MSPSQVPAVLPEAKFVFPRVPDQSASRRTQRTRTSEVNKTDTQVTPLLQCFYPGALAHGTSV